MMLQLIPLIRIPFTSMSSNAQINCQVRHEFSLNVGTKSRCHRSILAQLWSRANDLWSTNVSGVQHSHVIKGLFWHEAPHNTR